METNHQEKILEQYQTFEAVKDCFTISRLQQKIATLSGPAAFNSAPRKEMNDCNKQIDAILSKYPDNANGNYYEISTEEMRKRMTGDIDK